MVALRLALGQQAVLPACGVKVVAEMHEFLPGSRVCAGGGVKHPPVAALCAVEAVAGSNAVDICRGEAWMRVDAAAPSAVAGCSAAAPAAPGKGVGWVTLT
jgi:2-keto-3-deoxy-6-phosphogluconate aldolase